MHSLRVTFLKAALPLVSLAALVSIASCKSSDIPIGEDGQRISCATNADCPTDAVCGVTGYCAHACAADSDCAGSEVCMSGGCEEPNTCVPEAEVCDGLDNDCDGAVDDGATCTNGASCVNGQCVGANVCTADADCGTGMACVNGACQPDTCLPMLEICDGLDNDCDGVVDNDATCPNGGACVNGQCGGGPVCTADADCPAGLVCVANVCQPDTCLPMLEICDGMDNDCDGVVDDDATCPNGGACVNGQCGGGPVCMTNADCAAGQVCVANVCQPGTCGVGWADCDGDASNGCETDVASSPTSCGACGVVCSAGEVCAAGVCNGVTQCTSNQDCPAGQVCKAGLCGV